MRFVAVVGGSECSPEEAALAEEVGRRLAEAGFGVVCGGTGGVMAAACAGARKAGGITLGLLPGADARPANPDVLVAVPTGMGEMRNALIVRTAVALVAVGGEYGTLSEIALALKAGKPVVGLGTWRLWRSGREDGGIQIAESPAEAVMKILR